MSAGPLPQCVNLRKAVTRNARYEGLLGPRELPRFTDILSEGDRVHFTVVFGVDVEDRQFAEVTIDATVRLECQRCLERFERQVSGHSHLALVPSDEHAKHLPAGYEPWIAMDEVDLWNMAAEELALALPVVAYHDRDECTAPALLPGSGRNKDTGRDAPSDSPFNVLSTLLSDDDKEKQ